MRNKRLLVIDASHYILLVLSLLELLGWCLLSSPLFGCQILCVAHCGSGCGVCEVDVVVDVVGKLRTYRHEVCNKHFFVEFLPTMKHEQGRQLVHSKPICW